MSNMNEKLASVTDNRIAKVNSKQTASSFKRASVLFVALLIFTIISHILPIDSLEESIIFFINSDEPLEYFEVTSPYPEIHDSPVYHQKLLSYVFANSWGKPAIFEYSAPPPDINFNKVILTLNTSVAGVQYDRLSHFYIDGVCVWRSSTIEPGGKLVHSSATKDVSSYAKLFAKDGVQLMYQLDNIVTDKLDGAFDISLEATYYNIAPSDILVNDDDDDKPTFVQKFFENAEPADRVWSIVPQSAPDKPPLRSLPKESLKSYLPKFNANTTRARLELFVSGNGAEEFWYSNVIDKYTDAFPDYPLLGHGPCRMANIYLGSEKIASVMPEPTIYTGGISPALWRPIVSIGAFDVRALEIELTPALPLIWDAREEERELSVEITNCETNPASSGVGENWITTANILTWESDEVESSEGTYTTRLPNEPTYSTMSIGKPPEGVVVVVESSHSSNIQGLLNYTLTDGSHISVLADALTSFKLTNVQIYKGGGSQQTVAHAPVMQNSFSLTDATSTDNDLISQVDVYHTSNVAIALNTTTSKSDTIRFDVALGRSVMSKVYFDQSEAASIFFSTKQNGTSTYILEPSGNHGQGETEQWLKLYLDDPLPESAYIRQVIAKDGTVVKDHKTSSEAIAHDKYDESTIFNDQDSETAEAYQILETLVIRGDLVVDSFNMLSDVLLRTEPSSSSAVATDTDAEHGLTRSQIKLPRGMLHAFAS